MAVGDGASLTGELLFAEGLHGEAMDPQAQILLRSALGSKDARRALLEAFEQRCLLALDEAQFDVIALSKARAEGQPGLESLSTRLLRLMREGTSSCTH